MITYLYSFLYTWLWNYNVPADLLEVAPQITLLITLVGGLAFTWLIVKLVFGGLYQIIQAFRS